MKSERFVVVGDNHGDMIDPVMERLFFRWLADYNPTVRIHSGDLFDFRALRSGASMMEKQESMGDDFEAGLSFARNLFSGGGKRWYLRGNHCERLYDLLHNERGPLWDHAKLLTKSLDSEMKKLKVKVLPYDSRLGVLEIGHMAVIHGFGGGGPSTARDAAITYKSCIFGHTHATDMVPVKAIRGPSVAMGTGCMCVIDMPYNARQTNKLRHQQGWVYGELFPDGTYSAYQAKRVGDSVTAASGFKHYQ